MRSLLQSRIPSRLMEPRRVQGVVVGEHQRVLRVEPLPHRRVLRLELHVAGEEAPAPGIGVGEGPGPQTRGQEEQARVHRQRQGGKCEAEAVSEVWRRPA